jgi:hypothetical protein
MAISASLARKAAITIQGTKVGGAEVLGGFTLLLTEANIPAEALTLGGPDAMQADGGDVQFAADAEGAERLPAEIVHVAEGRFIGWVRMPSLSPGTDRTLWMFWRGGGSETQPATDAPYGRNAVWQDFVFVSHDGREDATGRHAIVLGGSPGSDAGPFGNAGGALTLDGQGQYGEADAALGASDYPFTLQAWLKPASLAPRAGLVGVFDASGSANWYDINTQSGCLSAFERSGGNVLDSYMAQTAALAVGAWQRGTGVIAGPAARRAYLNGGGEAVNGVNVSGSFTMNRIGFGRWGDATPSEYFAGGLAELWVRRADVSAARVAAEYENQTDPAGFAVTGAVELLGGTAAITPAGARHGHAAGEPVLASRQGLAVDGCAHAERAGSPVLTLPVVPVQPPRFGARGLKVRIEPRRLAIGLS